MAMAMATVDSDSNGEDNDDGKDNNDSKDDEYTTIKRGSGMNGGDDGDGDGDSNNDNRQGRQCSKPLSQPQVDKRG